MVERLIKKGFKPGDFVFKALIADEFGRAAIPRHQAVRDQVAYMDILKKQLSRVANKGQKYPQFEKLLNQRKSLVEKASVKEVEAWRLEVGKAIDFLVSK